MSRDAGMPSITWFLIICAVIALLTGSIPACKEILDADLRQQEQRKDNAERDRQDREDRVRAAREGRELPATQPSRPRLTREQELNRNAPKKTP